MRWFGVCLKALQFMAMETPQVAPRCGNRDLHHYFISFVLCWVRTFYIEHKIFLCPLCRMCWNVDLCSCLCWRWHFFARQMSQTALNNWILSVFDRRFRISWNAFSLWSLKCATIKTKLFWSAIFLQNHAKSSIMTFVSAVRLPPEKIRPKTHETKTFYSVVSLEVAILYTFSQHSVFLFLGFAGFLFWWVEVVTQHLSLLSHHCITYRMSASSEEREQAALFQVTVRSK